MSKPLEEYINLNIDEDNAVNLGLSNDEQISIESIEEDIIPVTLEEEPNLELSLENENDIQLVIDGLPIGGTKDYLDLINKPKINGTTLVTNYNEIDPTVPAWAKTDNKPNYTPEEVNAVSRDNEMSFADIKTVWDSIFNT